MDFATSFNVVPHPLRHHHLDVLDHVHHDLLVLTELGQGNREHGHEEKANKQLSQIATLL